MKKDYVILTSSLMRSNALGSEGGAGMSGYLADHFPAEGELRI